MKYYPVSFSMDLPDGARKLHSPPSGRENFVNRGFLNGPICPIYGIGVSLIITLLDGCKDQLIILYLVSTVLVTLLEWVTGVLLEKMFHHRWWDYSEMPLNIGGYVCPFFCRRLGNCLCHCCTFSPSADRTVHCLDSKWIGVTFLIHFLCNAVC